MFQGHSSASISYSESVRFFFRQLAGALTLTGFNFVIPPIFSLLAKFEMWRSQKTAVNLTLVRYKTVDTVKCVNQKKANLDVLLHPHPSSILFRVFFLKLFLLSVLVISAFAEVGDCQKGEACSRPVGNISSSRRAFHQGEV